MLPDGETCPGKKGEEGNPSRFSPVWHFQGVEASELKFVLIIYSVFN